jgi:hypothetical protein
VAGDGREVGWVVFWRRIRSSALWKSLRADQKGVLVTIVLMANWKPAQARWRDRFYEVARGELAHSLDEIAKEAGCTVKVVRTTLVALMADDRPLGGNGPFVTERYPISGTGPGTGPRVLRIEKYDEYQRVGGGPGTAPGTERAQPGHGPGTDRAEREPKKPDQPDQPGGAGGARFDPWADLVADLQPRLRPDLWARWFAALRGRVDGDQLLVEAPDRYHRDFVDDNHRPWMQERLSELGHQLEVHIVVAAPLRAAGGA